MERQRSQLPAYVLKRIQESQKELIERAERHLSLSQHGFRVAFLASETTKVIFDSEWCRLKIRILHAGPDPRDGELYIDYARLHAPNEEPYMMWNGEQCHCWHSSHYRLVYFLEGYAPIDAVGKFWDSVPVIGIYWQSEEGSRLRRDDPVEFGFKLEALIWERYGQRLFDLFDLRRPDLWEQYRQWLRAHYVAEGNSEERDKQFGITVPYYRVC